MKVIDLLNKIANGEEVPNKIKVQGHIFYYTKKYYSNLHYYEDEDGNNEWLVDEDINLNDEVEVIEESKKIEKIKLDSENCIEYYEDGIKKHLNTNKKDLMYVNIINKLIEKVEKLDEQNKNNKC